MTQLVADASSIGRALLPDETGVGGAGLLRLLADVELIEPAHWPIECASLFLKAMRRERLLNAQHKAIRDMLDVLFGSAEVEGVPRPLEAFDFAKAHHISVHDAAYLELASRRRLALMTNDGALSGAAKKAGIEVFVPA